MDASELAELSARRERYADEVQEFANLCEEYARSVSWRWTSADPDEFEAEVVLELYDGSTRSVPLVRSDTGDMAIDIDDSGFLFADAAGLYSYLWNHDAYDLRLAREALAKEREANALLRQHNMQLCSRLARALYQSEAGDCALEFHEQTADVQKAYMDMAFAKAMENQDAGANPVSAGAGAAAGSSPCGGGPKTACPPGPKHGEIG